MILTKIINLPKALFSLGFLTQSFVVAVQLHAFELTNRTIDENQDLMTIIGEFTFTVPDVGAWKTKLGEGENESRFKVLNNILYSFDSFDFEKKSSYEVRVIAENLISGELLESLFTIEVNDLTGKWDANGIADAELATVYEQVNEGDYLIFNEGNSGVNINFFQEIRHPNKILIKGGDYQQVRLTLSNVEGNSSEERVIISNFLGQVRTKSFTCANGSYWRLTGRYDPNHGIGSKYFRGCDTNESTVDFGGSHGSYGIWVSNQWADESSILCYILGTATGFEVDHFEISEGGFAGLMVKRDNGIQNMNDVYIHHMFIHDIGSEGLYLGSTQTDPQHQFENLLIENNVFLRTGGEAIQAGQMSEGSIIRNNVAWGAMDWMSPFARYQDTAVQLGSRQGDITFQHNIVMGGGQFLFASNAGKEEIIGSNNNVIQEAIIPNGEPIRINENLFWGTRGIHGVYQQYSTDEVTPWEYTNNYFGYYVFDYDRVYNLTNRNHHIDIRTPSVTVTMQNNAYSAGRTLYIKQGNSVVLSEDNQSQTILPPVFRNLIGESADYPYLMWKRWSARVGEENGFPGGDTKKGQLITYKPGEVVQHIHNGHSRFYLCLVQHSDREPSIDGDDTWKLLIWYVKGKLSYFPPDDARLVEGSYYADLNLGLYEEDPIVVEESPEKWAEFNYDDSNGNIDTNTFLGWINIELAPWVWDFSTASYLYVPEPSDAQAGAWIYFNDQ